MSRTGGITYPLPGSRYGIARITILYLRSCGWGFMRIHKETGYSKSTISYHLSSGQRERTIERNRRHRKRRKASRSSEASKPILPFNVTI